MNVEVPERQYAGSADDPVECTLPTRLYGVLLWRERGQISFGPDDGEKRWDCGHYPS